MCFFAAKPTFDNSVSVEPKGNIVKVDIHTGRTNNERKENAKFTEAELTQSNYFEFSLTHQPTTEHDWYESNFR